MKAFKITTNAKFKAQLNLMMEGNVRTCEVI